MLLPMMLEIVVQLESSLGMEMKYLLDPQPLDMEQETHTIRLSIIQKCSQWQPMLNVTNNRYSPEINFHYLIALVLNVTVFLESHF